MTLSPDGTWQIIPNYDQHSRIDHCSVTGMRLREGSEVGVFRPIRAHIDFEGYFDMSQYAVEQAARMIDWHPPEDLQALRDEIAALKDEVEGARKAAFKKAADAVKMAGVRAAGSDL